MIEMPEAITLAIQLNNTIKGKTAERIVTNYTPHKFAFFSGDTDEYDDLICGKTVKSASAYGGHIIISLDGAEIRFCDGAFPRYHAPESKLPEKHQLLIGFTDGSAITVTIAMYGFMGVYLENAMNGDVHYSVAKNAIPPVSDKFDFEYFKGLLGEKTIKLSAKAFLATEQRIPGLGNGVLQDILLNARIHPKKKMNTFTDAQLRKLFNSIRGTLRDMTEAGGRNVTRDLFGNTGGYVTKLSKNNKLLICPECGGAVTKEAYLGGSVYYCRECQEL